MSPTHLEWECVPNVTKLRIQSWQLGCGCGSIGVANVVGVVSLKCLAFKSDNPDSLTARVWLVRLGSWEIVDVPITIATTVSSAGSCDGLIPTHVDEQSNTWWTLLHNNRKRESLEGGKFGVAKRSEWPIYLHQSHRC